MEGRRRGHTHIVPGGTLAILFAWAGGLLGGESVVRSSSKECGVCHVRWIQAFERARVERGGGGTTGIEGAREAGNEDACLSCHDGSVVDSRFKVWSTRHHTTGQIPSPKVHIPTDTFPLDPDGRMTCATCHTAHAVPYDANIRSSIFLRRPNVDSSLCLECHSEHAQKDPRMHPLGRTESPVPQVILDAGGRAGPDGHRLMCQTCHEPHGARNEWMLVLPPSELCIACHAAQDPRAIAEDGPPVHRIGRTYPEFSPPESLLSEKATFGPNGELSCLSCHRLHDASGAQPLLVRGNEESALCLSCHEREKAVLGSAHDLRVSAPNALNALGKLPHESGPCGACHRVHGWARELAEAGDPREAACVGCHTQGGPGSQKSYVPAHPVGVSLPQGLSVPLPMDATTGKIGCLTCHEPHTPRSNAGETLVAAPGGMQRPAVAPGSFLRRGEPNLCALCHSGQADCLVAGHNPASFSPAVLEALGMDPSVGSCRTCHKSHGARGPHLWAWEPLSAGPSPTAMLCGACHGTKSIPSGGMTLHPIVPIKEEDGAPAAEPSAEIAQATAVDCSSCHDPHGGPDSLAKVRATEAAFCTTCHPGEQGLEGSPHDPRGSEWAQRIQLRPRGPCLDCHPVHGSPAEQGIWTALGADPDSAGSCEICHRAEGPGKPMETPHSKSPLDVRVEDPILGDAMEVGAVIRCATCHNIHDGVKGSKLVRGGRGDSRVCRACHPEAEAIVSTPHDLRRSAPENRNVCGDTASQSGPCGTCHLVHPISPSGTTWARAHAPGQELARCSDCHPQKNTHAARRATLFIDQIETARRTERFPGTPVAAGLVPTSLAPPVGDGEPPPDVTCFTCHEPHGIHAVKEKGESPLPRPRFLKDTVPASLCLRCHDREIEVERGRKLKNMAATLADSKFQHGPLRERGECIPCHTAHESRHYPLLPKQHPESFYAPFSVLRQGFCFSCHEEKLGMERTDPAATHFRNGSLNLHAVHVNRETNSENCWVCHETHASKIPRHIRPHVPYGAGGWRLPIDFKLTETGGSCSPGCHSAKSYDRTQTTGR